MFRPFVIAQRVGLVLLGGGCLLVHAAAQEPNATMREVIAVSGTVDRIDPFSRLLVLRTPEGQMQMYVGRDVKAFDQLKRGDAVNARVVESVIVAAKPGSRLTPPTDTTAAAKKEAGAGGEDVVQQLKATVRIESIDRGTNVVAYMMGDNRRGVRQVADPHLLEGLKPGDVVEITYTRARAIEIDKRP